MRTDQVSVSFEFHSFCGGTLKESRDAVALFVDSLHILEESDEIMNACPPWYCNLALAIIICFIGLCSAFQPQSVTTFTTKNVYVYLSNDKCNDEASLTATKVYFDIAILTPKDEIPVGRITFNLTPATHRYYLPLHISNLISLASSKRRSIDAKATYEGCTFQYSPATIEDGSFRYRWGHVCEGNGRNGIQTTSSSGLQTSWDEPFADPERIKECSHNCFGGVYYGQQYEEIVDLLAKDGQDVAILLTVPIQGPGAGTSKFSIVRVSESPKEWGELLLQNSAVVGYLDCGADGTFGEDDIESSSNDDNIRVNVPTALDVLRAMARQRMGPPKIVHSGIL